MKTHLLRITGDTVEVLEETSLDINMVSRFICKNTRLLPFITGEAHCYPRIITTENYRYVQIIGVPGQTRTYIYPIVYDYLSYRFEQDEEIGDIPRIFSGIDSLVNYMYWINKCRAQWAREYRMWIDEIRVSRRRNISIPLIVFAFNNANRELFDRASYINKYTMKNIGLLVIKTYKNRGEKLLSIQYYKP